MDEFNPPLSRNEAILQNILGAENDLEPARSRVEAILLSILNDTPYTDEPISRIEKILLAIKNKTEYNDPPRSRNEAILLCKLHGEEYTEPPRSRIEELLIAWASAAQPEKSTVTGTAPVTLEKAVVAELLTLIQYGKVEQATTPTPPAPVDIVCNNGALRMVDDELPSGYDRIKGITFDSSVYYQITDFYLKGSDTIRISFSVEKACNVFGCYTTTTATNNYSLYASTASGAKYLRYAGGTYKSQFASSTFGQRFDVVITPTGSSGMPSGQNDTWSEADFTATSALCIAHTSPSGTSSKLDGNIYGNIVVDGRLKLIPCIRTSDSEIGYYDTYTDTFYAPVTGTPASLGYDPSHLTLTVVGTPEVISVGGKNIFSGDIAQFTSQGGTGTTYAYFKLPEENAEYVLSLKCKKAFSGSAQRYLGFTGDGGRADNGVVWALNSTSSAQVGDVIRIVNLYAGTRRLNYVSIYAKTQAVLDDFAEHFDVQLERGSTVTDYAPYVTPQTASAVNLFAVGDYEDTQDIISGTVTRNVGVIVFDGTETTWALSDSGTTHRFRGTKPSDCYTPASRARLVSTHFVYASAGQMLGGAFIGASQYWYFIPTDQTMDTVEAWRAWLAAQYAAGTPVIVLYPLAEATTESVTPQGLSTVAGTNVISITAEVSPIELEVEYYKEADA